MKHALLLTSVIALCGLAQAVTLSWNNRYSYGAYTASTTWANGKNTAGSPVLSLNTNTTTGKVHEAPSRFADGYATETFFGALNGRLQIASIVLSAPNTSAWNSAPYLVLKSGDKTWVSQSGTVSNNKNFKVYNTSGGLQSSWNPMTFLFDTAIDLTPGQTYELYFASNADGTLMDASVLNKVMLVGGNVDISFDAQLDYTPVPEPTALALLALGVAGLVLRRKIA